MRRGSRATGRNGSSCRAGCGPRRLSEAELYRIKARWDQGVLNKARRGELYMHVPTGCVVDGQRLRKDPDRDVRAVVGEVFQRFRELGTARQVTRQLWAEGMKLPTRHADERGLE